MSAFFSASDSIIMGIITNRIRVELFLTQNWAPSFDEKIRVTISIFDFPAAAKI